MFIRVLNSLVILLLIDFFGLLPENSVSKILTDALLIGLTVLVLVLKKFRLVPVEKFVQRLFLFFACIAVLTLIRGGSGIGDIYKFVRIYFPFLLIFPLTYDIQHTNSGFRYYRSLLQSIAVVVSVILLLISVVKVDFFASWPRIAYGSQEDDYIFGLQRVYIFNSFTFPIVEFVLLIFAYLLGKKVNTYVFILVTAGFLLQGYRTYIIVTLAVVAILIFNYYRKQNLAAFTNFLRKNFLYVVFVFFVGFSFIGRHVITGINDFVNVSGTFGSRILMDAFRIQVFLESPWLGVGFLHNDSERAKQMGVTSSEELKAYAKAGDDYDAMQAASIYSLRSTDSGYLDLLIQFGIVGAIAFLVIYLSFYVQTGRALNHNLRDDTKIYVLHVKALFLIFLLTLLTHSGLTNIYGLVPLAFALSLAQGKVSADVFTERLRTEPAVAG